MTDLLFARMRADGVCRYGNSREEWAQTWRERTVRNPPALLGALDFEWMNPEDAEAWEPPDYWLEEHPLEPFGQNGAGDLFAFYAHYGNAVVLAAHDVNECRVLAPSLEGFLYREMLEALTYEYERTNDFSDRDFGPRGNGQVLRGERRCI